MITVKYCGQTCNRLYQYVFARILAEKWKMKLECEKPDAMFPRCVSQQGIVSSEDFVCCTDLNDEDVFDGEPRAVMSYGFHQKYQFYRHRKEIIRPWVVADVPNTPKADVVVHIRRGDYFQHGSALCLGYYGRVLRMIGARRIHVVGPVIDDVTREYLDEWDPIYTTNGYRYDYALLLRAKVIVMSNSTFCWWAAWMSNAEQIFFPIPDKGLFSRNYPGRSNWIVDDEPRYRFIENITIDPGPQE